MNAVRLYGVHVPHRRADIDPADAVRTAAGFEALDALDETPRVRQHDRLDVERIGRREHRAAAAESARRHRFDQRVDVARMIEMLVRKHDSVELARIARRNVRERAHERAGTGIHVQLRFAEAHPHAAGGAQLPRNDEARAAAAEKENRGR